ncbi:MAG: ATP-binding protein [Pseudonocardia sp.]|nr:ATP-binding protein [Pseudonocardia sp.]
MSPSFSTPLGRVVPRRSAAAVLAAMADTRVVLVNGARQSGKSTLVGLLARERPAEWRNLDSVLHRDAAHADPVGFVESDGLMVIDEIQRVPDLLLAIKQQVDTDPRPGRYLLTGSARVLGLRALPDTLPGRTETVELFPFSQGEIDGDPDGFVDAVFRDGAALEHRSDVTRSDYAERVVRGGFPEAVSRPAAERRASFFDSYLTDLITRDVSQLSEIERPREMRALLRLLAGRSAQPLVVNTLANDLRLSARSVHRYLALLEEVFLVKRIPAWSRNVSARATGNPKLVYVDSGIAADLLGADARSLLRPGGPVGPLLEGFVLSELARQLTWSKRRVDLSHYRTKDGVEVDAVLEDRRGDVVGIEVKASSTVRSGDFRGLRHLADRLGEDLIAGLVLYTGTDTLSFGGRMRAVPISAVWQVR